MEGNLYTHEKSKHAFKSSSTKAHSSILRLSLRQYVEPQIDITFTLFPVSFTFLFRNLCKSSSRPCFPVPYFFLSDIICYLSLCTSAIQLMCEPCNVLQSGPRFDFLQPFFPFGTYASRLVAPAVQFPMDLCSASAIQPISFLLVVSQNSFNSIKLQISNPKFPLLLFTLSNAPKQNYTTVLLISQDTLQSSNAANLVELHASLLVVQDVQSTWPKVRKGNPPGSTNITSILFSNYISTKGSAIANVGKSHWQSSL